MKTRKRNGQMIAANTQSQTVKADDKLVRTTTRTEVYKRQVDFADIVDAGVTFRELSMDVTPSSLVLDSIPKSRPIGEAELIERYTRLCERNRVLPLWGQIRTSLKLLLGQGRIRFVETQAGKLVKKV